MNDDDCILLDDEPAGHDSFDEIEYTDTQPPTDNAYHLDSDDSFNDEGYEVTQREDGMLSIIACFGHVGHELNSAAIPLSASDVTVVRFLIEAGISANIVR
ncbi:unnamed protein product [Cylicocyclus nassatus]|uniref:Uncharacterized protein n=1 Tax=Cylicocyclus nassatus TaxID=53992 RepID=A0AA36GI84_CYLNA|nr:unnamed protein product [Cylicocyclus nassatus]